MNLREAGGAALLCLRFRFRLPRAEACTPRNVAALLGIALAQTCLRSHHEQCRDLITPHGCQRSASTRQSMTTYRSQAHLRTNLTGSQATKERVAVRRFFWESGIGPGIMLCRVKTATGRRYLRRGMYPQGHGQLAVRLHRFGLSGS